MATSAWRTKVVKEFKTSKSVVWRATLSISPDNKKFVGVRKYIKKADGTEIADRQGISIPYDKETLRDTVEMFQSLFGALAPKE